LNPRPFYDIIYLSSFGEHIVMDRNSVG